MNSNRRVVLLVLLSTGLFLVISLIGSFLDVEWMPFRRVSLVSEVLKNADDSLVTDGSGPNPADTASAPVLVENKPAQDFGLYEQARTITGFYTDSNRVSLERFAAKLHELKTGGKRKIRIAYFGDSMIEGDLLTQTLRKLLQQQFGGDGVGFVPITSQVSKFRQTVYSTYSDNWTDDNFKEGKNSHVYLSGHVFHTTDGWVQLNDQTIHDSAAVVEKSLLYGRTESPVTITVNEQALQLNGDKAVNRQPLADNGSHVIRVGVNNDALPVYGVSFESASGIFVDNFSFRGITGIEFGRVDSSFMAAIAQENPYDLIVFQYGVNLLFRPNDKNFSWYARAMLPIIRRIRNTFSSADFVLVSTADRAFRYGGEYKSAVGVDSLVKAQAIMAYETGSAFYNQFLSMGGTNSIVDWAKQKPSLANQDYVHPNHRGAEILGTYFYEAILHEYDKYLRNPTKKTTN